MFNQLLPCALVCLSGVALAGDASQEVSNAAKKLSDTGNYTWKAVTDDVGNGGVTLIQDGKTDKTGYTVLSLNSGDYNVQLVLKGGNGVINIGGGWKTADDMADQRRAARFMTMMARSFRSPAVLALEIVSKLKNLKKEEDAYTADVNGDDANKLIGSLSGLRGSGGREMSNAKATVRFWVRDGGLMKYQVRTTGTISRNGNETDIDRTTTVEFRDVGNTRVEVPEEVKKKLG